MQFYQDTSIIKKSIDNKGGVITSQKLLPLAGRHYHNYFGTAGGQSAFEQQGQIPASVLRKVSEKAFLINICINHACRLASPFTHPITGKTTKGFSITLKDKNAQVTPEQKARITQLENFFSNCGFNKDNERGSLLRFMKKGIRDLLTLDQITTEIQYRVDGTPFAFWTIDPATIYRHAQTSIDDNIDFIQMIDCLPVAEFTSNQLIFDVMNPRSDIEHSLYGYSYVEQAIELITGMINSFTYNQGNFISDNLPRGAILINGDPDQKNVEIISDYIINMMSDPSQKWRIPVFPSGDENGTIQWVSFQKGNRDMEFTEWTNRLWTSVTALFGTDLEELGIRVNTGTSVIPENPEARIKASKSRVLDDVLRFFQDHFQHILDLIDNRFCFEFIGAEQNDLKLQAEVRTNKLSTCYTTNELRKEEGLPAIDEDWANVPLNPQLVILRGQMAGEQQKQQGSGLEDDDDDNPDDDPNGTDKEENDEEEYKSKYEDIDINPKDVEKSIDTSKCHKEEITDKNGVRRNVWKKNAEIESDIKSEKKQGYVSKLRKKLKEKLYPLFGLHKNKNTGIEASLSGRSVDKMTSEKAIEKSKNNGFTVDEHFEVASQITELFKNADLVETAPDKKGSPDIKSIKRFDCNVNLKSNKKAKAHITVKESIENGHKIYSVEVMELQKKTTDKTSVVGGEILSNTSTSTSSISKSIEKSTFTKLDYFKKKLIDILVSQEKEENQNVEKAVKANIGEIRTRKDGFKYKKINNGEWKRVYESETRGAKHSIAAIKRKIDNAKDEEELMNIIMTNKQRFVDSMGFMLPIVQELNDYIDQKQAKNAKPVVKENLTTENVNGEHGNKTAMLGNQNAKKDFTEADKKEVLNLLSNPTDEMPNVDYTRDNYNKLFPEGKIKTPIGEVKLGEHQFERLGEKDGGARRNLLGAMYETLKNPTVIIDEIDKENREAKVYIKTFNKKDSKKGTIAVVVDKDGKSISVSFGERKIKQMENKIKTASIFYYKAEGGSPTIGTGLNPLPNQEENIPHEETSVNKETQDNQFDDIKTKYQSSKSVSGDEDEIILPDGSTVSGTWKIVEATAPSASHDEKTFQKTNGFPTNTDGSTINDRDYEHDIQAQEMVHKIASDYDGRALSLDNPVVVTQDGVVISGNNRTMSSKIAARKGTDSKYIETLAKRCKKFGFSEDDLQGFKNPRIVFETQQNNYSTKEFAKYNQSDKKTISPIEQAVKIAKTIDFNTIENIAESINEYETLGDMYQDKDVCSDIFNSLKESSIISDFDLPQYINNGIPTVAGKDFLETVLIGSVINENNLRSLNQDGCKNIRAKLVRAILPLTKNKGLKNGYSVNKELNEAIEIYAEIANDKNIKNVKEYAQQGNFFKKPDPLALAFAEKLEGTQKEFAQLMNDMNGSLREAADGQFDMFFGGIESREDILSRFLDIKKSLRQLKKAFEESAHPRSENGRFTSKGNNEEVTDSKYKSTSYINTLRNKLFKDLEEHLGIIKNKETNIEARLSNSSIDKMASGKAINKSKNNGFTVEEHFEVASQITELFKNADLVETTPDKKGSENLISIKRFDCDTDLLSGKKVTAHITVKESLQHGHKIYSIEVMSLKEKSDQNTSNRLRGEAVNQTPTSTSNISKPINKSRNAKVKIAKHSNKILIEV